VPAFYVQPIDFIEIFLKSAKESPQAAANLGVVNKHT
jgi:hypothetical protein